MQKLSRVVVHGILGTITQVVTREPAVALTFDDGPHPEHTPRLLDLLKKYAIRATFFMVGEAAADHPQLVKRVAHAGHIIGNHSWNHPSFPLISRTERKSQIRECGKVLAPYGVPLFRPPYTDQDIASRIDALLLGYQVVGFNVGTDDWCSNDSSVIAEQLERRVCAGSIVVLHDRLADSDRPALFNRQPMIDGLEIFLRRKGKEFEFVTVTELLRLGPARKEIWYKEPNVEFLNTLTSIDGSSRKYVQPQTSRHKKLVRMFVRARS